MKSKFFFVMSVAATMLLASCGGSQNTSSQATSQQAGTSEQGTSQEAQTPKVVSVTCDATAQVEVGKKVTLTPTVTVEGGASKICLFASSDKAIATVNDAGVVTGVAEGKAKITITAKADSTKKCEVEVTVIGEQVTAIGAITQLGNYTIKGVVAAITDKGYILDDGTGAIYVHVNSKPSVTLNSYLKLDGKLIEYSGHGSWQFAAADCKVEEITGETAPTLAAAEELTVAVADKWADDKKILPSQAKRYKYTTKAVLDGAYYIFNLDGSKCKIEPSYPSQTIEDGKTYEVEGYIASYDSKYSYANLYITSLTEKQAEAGDVTITATVKSVVVGNTITLSAAVAGNESAQITWSFKESGMSELAELTPDDGFGKTVLVKGLKAGSVTVVATSGEKSDEVTIAVTAFTKLNNLKKDETIAVDGVVYALGYQGFVIADDTSVAFVYQGANATAPEVGAHVTLQAKVGQRNGGVQLTNPVIDVATGAAPTVVAPKEMTEALGLEIVAEVKAAKDGSRLPDLAKVGLYKFEGVNVKAGSGTYRFFDVGTAHFETGNCDNALLEKLSADGGKYDIEGVVYASYTDNDKVNYATVVLTKVEESQKEVGEVSISGPKEVNVGESIELTAAVEGVDTATVEWSLKETAMADRATLTPNGLKATVTGKVAGDVTVVATYEGKSAEYAVKVKDPSAVINYGTQENPLSVSEAAAIIEALENKASTPEKMYVTGQVKSRVNENAFWITDGTKEVEIYYYNLGENVTDPVVGDTIVAYGFGKKYNTTLEMNGPKEDNVVILSVTHPQAEVGEVSISGPKEVTVGESIELTAAVEGVDTATVEWSLKETAMADRATLTPNGLKATVTGKAAGDVTVVATYEGKSAEYEVEVKTAPTKEHGTAENPISVASAKDLCDDLTVPAAGQSNYDENMLFVEGVITKVTYAWGGANKSMSFELKDANGLDSDAIACQFIYLADDFKVAPVVGETVLLRGYACIYKKNAETAEVLQISAPKNATAETRATVLNVVGDRASVGITLGDHANATVNGLPETAKLESTVSFTVEVDSGYKIDAVKVNGVAANAVEGVYSFMVEKETTIVIQTSEEGVTPTGATVAKTVDVLAEENQWEVCSGSGSFADKRVDPFSLGEVAVTFTGTGNTGTVWSDKGTLQIRVYGTKNTSNAGVTFTASSGYKIDSIVLTYTLNNNPTFPIESGALVEVDDTTVTYSLTSGSSNGQIRITGFEVTYSPIIE